MRRIVCVWLPRWPTDHLRRQRRRESRTAQTASGKTPAEQPPAGQPPSTASSPTPREGSLEEAPLALLVSTAGGLRIAACCARADAEGAVLGQGAADARALVPGLACEPFDPQGARAGLERLALWAQRYTPWCAPTDVVETVPVSPDAPVTEYPGGGGLFLDVTGAAHLFAPKDTPEKTSSGPDDPARIAAGEQALVEDLLTRLAAMGIEARAALADTLGAAWALAHYAVPERALSAQRSAWLIAPPAGLASDAGREAIRPLTRLPVASLRLPGRIVEGLRALGLKTVGEVLARPRAPLARRFGSVLLTRLDQAIGRANEPLNPRRPPADFRVRARLAEPISRVEHVVEGAGRLAEDLCAHLAQEGRGAKRLRLDLFRVDGEVTSVEVGAAAPARDPGHMIRLLRDKLERLEHGFDAGYGFETLVLSVPASQALPPSQDVLQGAHPPQTDDGQDLKRRAGEDRIDPALLRLVDRIGNRLGLERVRRITPRDSHIPERAVAAVPWHGGAAAHAPASGADWGGFGAGERPPALLSDPEPVEAVAEVPDGPPQLFRWRRVTYRVIKAEGPERLSTEWWHDPEAVTRDYYRVEDEAGRRFWLYRAGLYGEDTAPSWFLHGLFP